MICTITSFASTLVPKQKPLSVLGTVQLLWINLIMDTFAALALATDPPSPDLLNRKPSSRQDSIISPDMFKMIVSQTIYQVTVCLVLYFCGPSWFKPSSTDFNLLEETGVDDITATLVFNVFVMCQVFNEINCRSISRGKHL